MKRLLRWCGLRLGLTPVTICDVRDGGYSFAVRAKWWASREDLYAAVARAKADGAIKTCGPLDFGGADRTLWE